MDTRTFGTLTALAAAGLFVAGCAPRPEAPTLAGIVDASAPLSTFAAALDAAELSGRLESEDAYTVFAPVDRAFEALPPEVLDAVILSASPDELRRVLRAHIVPGTVLAADLAGETTELTSIDGTTLLVRGDLTVRGARGNVARILEPDVLASNGVVHVIDRVLLP